MDNEEIAYRPGDVLADKYKVDRVIGMGGFGAVLAATHLKLEQQVAIKVLLPHAAKNSAASERFMREARAAVKIKSEHVAAVKDVGQLSDGTPFMEMEYLEGEDLASVLKTRGGGQAVHDVAEWVVQACEALAEAHGLGIVHRDLKPANLFLTYKIDGAPCVKVLDFGISKMANEIGDKGMTKTSDVMGSPFYMSPEQMRSTRSVDARSDVWALGAILFEMLAGHPPFDADTMTALVVSIMQEPPREISSFRHDIPPGLRDIILCCLEKDPSKRFQDIASLATALAPFAPSRARINVQRVMAISGRHSNPLIPSSGQRPKSGVAPTQPGAETMAGAPASVAFREIASQSSPGGAQSYGVSYGQGVPGAGSHPPTQLGQYPASHGQSGSFGQSGIDPSAAYAQSGDHALSGSISGDSPSIQGNPALLAGSNALPAQSWGGTYMGKKQSASKAPLIVGLIALGVALIGGGGGAYYLMTKPSKAATSKSDEPDVAAARKTKADDDATATATATATAEATVAAQPTASVAETPSVEPVETQSASTQPAGKPTGRPTGRPPVTSKPQPTVVVIPIPTPTPTPTPIKTQQPTVAPTPVKTVTKPPDDPLFGSPD